MFTRLWRNASQLLRNTKISTKLFLSYLLVAFIPICFWSVSSFHHANQNIAEQAEDYLASAFASTQRNLESKISELEQSMQILTANDRMVQAVNEKGRSAYERYLDVTERIDSVVDAFLVYTPYAKKVVFYTDGDIQGCRESFRSTAEFEQLYRKSCNQMVVDHFWRVQEDDISLAYIMYDRYRNESLSAAEVLIQRDAFFETGIAENDMFEYCVSTTCGDILYGNGAILSKETGSSPNGQTMSRTLANTDWILTIWMSTEEYSSSAIRSLGYTAALLIILLMLTFLVTALFTREMTQRVRGICDQLKTVVSSRFQVDIHSTDKDEVGVIINSIGAMVQETRALITEVYESRILLREAEIKALQAQINPHFLYNTLSAINWQALRSHNAEISQLVLHMSDFYRTTLNSGSNITTVQKELKNVDAYLQIQLTLHSHAFAVEYDLAPEIMEYQMPNLILQPVVENSIEHGFGTRLNRKGCIRISAHCEEGDILFRIADNGIGMSEETLSHILVESDRKGYGVSNVNARLRLFFGEGYGIRFESRLGVGTTAVIRIPQYTQNAKLPGKDALPSGENDM